jgi:uncharacterized RDD family membrane protein YckC
MKCPKCGYLSFETSERCRNCGYDFSLTPSSSAAFDLPVSSDSEPIIPSADARREPRATLDLNRIIGGPAGVTPADLPLFPPSDGLSNAADSPANRLRQGYGGQEGEYDVPGRQGYGSQVAGRDDFAPLITPSRPRPPLGVRRATPEVPRAKIRAPKPSDDTLFEPPPIFGSRAAAESVAEGEASASPLSRAVAGLLDFSLLLALDGAVLYFTLRLLGLTTSEIPQLPLIPLAAFLLLLNGGYFIAFTTVGGQSIGKMALGIKVIGQDEASVPVGRATVRTLAYLVSALPLGAGFLAALLTADRLALHDRLAHTRVVRPSI